MNNQTAADTSLRALCQDCLRVVTYQNKEELLAAHNEEVFCQCSGQLCACGGCTDDIALLENGEFNAFDSLLSGVVKWDAETGATFAFKGGKA